MNGYQQQPQQLRISLGSPLCFLGMLTTTALLHNCVSSALHYRQSGRGQEETMKKMRDLMNHSYDDNDDELRAGNGVAVVSNTSFPPEGMTYNKTVWEAFAAKTLLNPYVLPPFEWNPYTAEPPINTSWPDTVCAVQYPNPSNRSTYVLKNFTSRAAAEAVPGTFVTHLHPCGFCSTTEDLSTYMRLMDLTTESRRCGMEGLLSFDDSVRCMHDIGFTMPCALIWARDAWNSARHCFDICVEAWIEGWPNNMPPNSTTLNKCIACDEEKSGPIFKLFAGRTRRDSGLRSSINRPPNEVYHVIHDYY